MSDSFVTAFLLPFSSVNAGAGEWDSRGTYNADNWSSSHEAFATPAVDSGGGAFKFCVSDQPVGGDWYRLWENDPGSRNDDYVGRKWLHHGECFTVRDIGRFVDGNNKKAEFYVVVDHYYAKISFYD